MKKHPQFILALDNTFFTCRNEFSQPYSHFDFSRFLQEAQSYLAVREREQLEKNPAYRQILPYVVVTRKGADGIVRIAPYRRTSGVGESRLAGNVSIGYGGHIDLQDIYVSDKSVIGLGETIFEAMLRELGEEITLSHNGVVLTEQEVIGVFREAKAEMNGKNFILDNSNEVGTVHVGLVFFVEIDPAYVIESREDELTNMPLMTVAELQKLEEVKESWSQIILNELTLQAGETA